ncbi:hypothetical protein Tco_0373467 [Tanacetum coccineum]
MANRSSEDHGLMKAGSSLIQTEILSRYTVHDQYQVDVCEHHEEHEMHDDVQPIYVVDSHVDYNDDSNMIPAENGKIKQHYKELYDSIKIMHAKHLEQTTTLLTENESLKVQIQNKLSCVTKDHVKPKVLAPGKYAIDVEPIPPRNRNNREVHLYYLKHLKESVETLRGIVEEVKVERPLDSSLASACLYTKHSQELLEHVIGTCPKALNTRDNKHASTSLPKKKQVTFDKQYAMSKSNTHKPVEQLNCQKTNVPVPPSTGVNSCTDISRSQPRSNTKKNRILQAKSVNMKKVEEHPMTITSSLKITNRVDSSISSKRRTDCPLVFGLRLFKTYDEGSLAAQEFREKVHRDG